MESHKAIKPYNRKYFYNAKHIYGKPYSNLCGNTKNQKYGNMEIWKYGKVERQQYGNMVMLKYGNIEKGIARCAAFCFRVEGYWQSANPTFSF